MPASQWEKDQLINSVKWFIKHHGWSETAKTLREVVFVHVGWNSDFTELDNVLRKIERDFKNVLPRLWQAKEDKLDIPNLPDGSVSDHFS